MVKVFAVVAGAVLVTFVSGTASAQEPDDAMLCIYDAGSAQDSEAVADAFL